MKLSEMHPDEAEQRYLTEKRTHVTQKPLYNYTTTLDQFTAWLADHDIADMRDVDSETVDRFKHDRLRDVKPITARNDLRTVKNFLKQCETYQCVPAGLHELVRPPHVNPDDEINETILTREEARAILDHLSTCEYASTRHAILLILWKTGMRLSGLRALDVDDVDFSRPALELRHRPETETPLKQKRDGECDVNITESTAASLRDYVDHGRPDVTDEYGRTPLIATRYGRIARSTLTRHVYRATSPCYYNADCPVDEIESPSACPHATYADAYGCSASVSPHALRRGYVTAARNAGQPKDVTGDRVNMSGPVLDKHYDHGSYDEKAERRKRSLRDI